jgi:hypothetical protein
MQSLIITTKSLIKILIQLFTDSKICWFLLSARKFHNLTCQTVGHSIWSSNFLWRILTHVFVFFNLTCQTVGHSIWSSNFLWHVLTHVFVFFHLCYSQTTVKLLQQVSDSHLSENTSFSIIINKLIKNIFIQYYG